MTNFNKVKKVSVISKYKLFVVFMNDEKRIYDVSALFNKWEAFKNLINVQGLFEQVHVDAGGYGISWNDELDLSCNELYLNGEPA